MKLKMRNAKLSKAIYVLIILVSAVIIPVYFLSGSMLSAPNAMQWLLIILYSFAVIGFAFLAAGIKITNITSEETDRKIIEKKAAIDRALKPLIISILIGWLIWLAHTIWAS